MSAAIAEGSTSVTVSLGRWLLEIGGPVMPVLLALGLVTAGAIACDALTRCGGLGRSGRADLIDRVLNLGVQAAPNVGLLGTVLGLADTFGIRGSGSTLTSAAIYEGLGPALSTTICGLVVMLAGLTWTTIRPEAPPLVEADSARGPGELGDELRPTRLGSRQAADAADPRLPAGLVDDRPQVGSVIALAASAGHTAWPCDVEAKVHFIGPAKSFEELGVTAALFDPRAGRVSLGRGKGWLPVESLSRCGVHAQHAIVIPASDPTMREQSGSVRAPGDDSSPVPVAILDLGAARRLEQSVQAWLSENPGAGSLKVRWHKNLISVCDEARAPAKRAMQ